MKHLSATQPNRRRSVVVTLLGLFALATALFAVDSHRRHVMLIEDAVGVIDAMIGSLRSNPQQFQIQVSVIGQQNTSYGGIASSVTAQGGAAGSTTIGQIVSPGDAQVRLAQQAAGQVMSDQMTALTGVLTEIRGELASGKPDKSKVRRLYESLRDTWVPGIITSVLGNLLTSALLL